MAVIQISRIQHRRGLQADLPNLASAELGWSVDTRKLYIGNGTIEEGAPSLGKTEVLTQYSILDFETTFAANITALQANVTTINGQIAVIQGQVPTKTFTNLAIAATAATITSSTANNSVISYTLGQGANERSGTIKFSRASSTVAYIEDSTDTGSTDVVFTMNANVTHTNLNYTAGAVANLIYSFNTV
jgi:hypothetical protein